MARKRRAYCQRCGRQFTLCRYNRHHQNCCTHDACVIERRRERQRVSYGKRYRENDAFREAEQNRCRERGRRVSAVEAPRPVAAINVELLAAGMLAQMIDSSDPAEVLGTARALEQRGQRLAVFAQSSRGSPR